jgi:phenylalanyl-tRNA synthetase beta subunit
MWVVQENALAAKITIQVGNQTITWRCGPETYRAICRIKFIVISPAWDAAELHGVNFRPLLEILEQSMIITRKEMNKPCRDVTLLDQVFDMRYRRAIDRRDMLFALRNMVPEHIKERIVVDYEKPVTEVYAEFFEEVKKAYMDEMQFVDEFEKERLRRMKEQENAPRRYGLAW